MAFTWNQLKEYIDSVLPEDQLDDEVNVLTCWGLNADGKPVFDRTRGFHVVSPVAADKDRKDSFGRLVAPDGDHYLLATPILDDKGSVCIDCC